MRFAIRYPNLFTLSWMCFINQFLTSGRQVNIIVQALRRRGPCRLLIFGFGNDSPFYHEINAGGCTVFLEDDPRWFNSITAKYPQLEAHRISYRTRRGEWRRYLENPNLYATELPPDVSATKWDIIFVDAPAGFTDDQPGRMDSIRLGATLIEPQGDVFVHDCEREVERACSTHFLKTGNLKEEVGNLRHYVISVT